MPATCRWIQDALTRRAAGWRLAVALALVAPLMADAAPASPLPVPDAQTTGAPSGVPAAPSVPPAAGMAPARIELNHFLELNSFLQVQGTYTGPTRPEYAPFVRVYAAHRTAPAEVWHAIHDVSVEAMEIADIAAGAKSLPPSLKPEDREVARAMLEAMAGAWPVYDQADRAPRQAALENVRLEVERRFTRRAEAILVPELLGRLLLKPLDQPITIWPVNRSPRPGDSGRTRRGYYIVQPAAGVAIVESLVHELTHLLDDNQPPGQLTLLRRVVSQARGISPDTVDAFVHGLIMWNARELVKRRLEPEGTPRFPSSMTPWLGIYEKVWGRYLDGAASADETIDKLVEELARSNPAGTSTPTASSR